MRWTNHPTNRRSRDELKGQRTADGSILGGSLEREVAHEQMDPFASHVRSELISLMNDENVTIPLEVSKLANLGRKSLARAWREHLGLTKEQAAARMGISVAALEQIEARSAKPRRATLAKVAAALGIKVEQLMAQGPVGG